MHSGEAIMYVLFVVPLVFEKSFIFSQGHLVDELSNLLIREYGLPKHVVNVQLSKGIKPKKK